MNQSTDTRAYVFTPEDHAMVFAVLSDVMIRRFGQRAKGPLAKAVSRYGLERGGRMAQRAQADGNPLTLASYISYGEWQTQPGAIQFYFSQYEPQVLWQTDRCPWAVAWEEHETPMEIRRLYCDYVDEALGQGFAGYRMLVVHQHKHKGDPFCLFEYPGAHMNETLYREAVQRKADMRDRVVMGWDFHIAHLYYTMLSSLEEDLGGPLKDDFQDAVSRLEGGGAILAAVGQYEGHDFTRA